MKIIFPNGVTVEVPEATHITTCDRGYIIFDKYPNGKHLGYIPGDCLVLIDVKAKVVVPK